MAGSAVVPSEANLFYARLRSLRQLVLQAAAEAGWHPWILPVPSGPIFASLRLGAFLHLPLPVSADNLEGFLANQQAQHVSMVEEEKI